MKKEKKGMTIKCSFDNAVDVKRAQSWDIVLVGIATKTKPGIIIQNDNGA